MFPVRIPGPAWALVALVVSSLPVDASALTYNGNPNLGIYVDRPAHDFTGGSVYLTGFRVFNCGGGYTDYLVGATIDPVDGYNVAISAGDYCSVNVYWGNTMVVHGPSYTVDYDEPYTSVTLAAPIPPVALTPYEVVSGSMSGVGPKLFLTID